MRALARNDQEHLAKQLDEELAQQFIKKPSAFASMSATAFAVVMSVRPSVCLSDALVILKYACITPQFLEVIFCNHEFRDSLQASAEIGPVICCISETVQDRR